MFLRDLVLELLTADAWEVLAIRLQVPDFWLRGWCRWRCHINVFTWQFFEFLLWDWPCSRHRKYGRSQDCCLGEELRFQEVFMSVDRRPAHNKQIKEHEFEQAWVLAVQLVGYFKTLIQPCTYLTISHNDYTISWFVHSDRCVERVIWSDLPSSRGGRSDPISQPTKMRSGKVKLSGQGHTAPSSAGRRRRPWGSG